MPFPYNLRCPFGIGGEAVLTRAFVTSSVCWMTTNLASWNLPRWSSSLCKVRAVIPAPASWLQGSRRICDEHAILLDFWWNLVVWWAKLAIDLRLKSQALIPISYVCLKRLVADRSCRCLYSIRASILGKRVSTLAHSVVISWQWYLALRRWKSSNVMVCWTREHRRPIFTSWAWEDSIACELYCWSSG